MPRVPLKQIGSLYAQSVMGQYCIDSPTSTLELIENWIHGSQKECLGFSIDALYPGLNTRQKRQISKYAKQNAIQIRNEFMSRDLYWYPNTHYNPYTEESGFDIYD